MSETLIRLAKPDEVRILTELAISAKASWGYDEAFIEQCREELTFTPAKMMAWTIWVAERNGQVVGVLAMSVIEGRAEIEEFMVMPEWQRAGVGTALMQTMFAECIRLSIDRLGLDADPNAERIYAKFGFKTVGRVPSGSIPGRTLPRMERVLAAR